jgi:capsular exopolysaccharide synthesis family protein
VADAAVKRRAGLVDPGSPSAEPFRSLRLALQLRRDQGSPKAVLFTSAEPGEGKSTIAANYALISSLSVNNVLLIDGDLRKPMIHELFGLPRSPGLVEILAAGSDVHDATISIPTLGRLDVLPAGRPVPRSGDVASSTRMGELLQQAAESYSLIVIDSPPVLSAADAAGLASHAGVEVVVVLKRAGRRRTIRQALRKLELIDAEVAGVVLNREGHLASYAY